MHIQLTYHFYLFYLLLNRCDGKDAKQRVFLHRLLVALKRAGCIVCWVWKCRFQFSRCSKWCTFAFMLAHSRNCFSVLWYACSCVSDALHQVAGVADTCLVECTHIHTNSVVNRLSRSTGLFGGHIWRDKIRCFLLKELDSFTSIEWRRQNVSLSRSYLK